MGLALSGGGDSVALLHLAADWTRRRGRRLVAVTVDHGLNPHSADWSRRCAILARDAGADWIGRLWTGDKPTTGIAAAARAARHALIAEAARAAGARVVLFAHTRDDMLEAERMRAEGANLGRLREWSPSPAWPEGRGLMLFRPLLDQRRGALRTFLAARGADWIEDPANDDPRHHRARARRALAGAAEATVAEAKVAVATATGGAEETVQFEPLPFGAGFVTDRRVSATALAVLLLSASGGTRPPRGERLERLIARLRGREAVSAVLAGARVETAGETVRIGREPGERRRGHGRGEADRPRGLAPGVAAVWDGRVEITAPEPGWRVAGAAGRLNRLSREDRTALSVLPAWARGAAAVLIRDGEDAPVLAGRVGAARFLAPRRALLALSAWGMTVTGRGAEGETTQESGLFAPVHGETPMTDLFSDATKTSAPRERAPENRKPK